MTAFFASLRIALLTPVALTLLAPSAPAQNAVVAAQPSQGGEPGCEKLEPKAVRVDCWTRNAGFNCFLLADADERIDCILSPRPRGGAGLLTPGGTVPDLPFPVPDGSTATVPPDWRRYFDEEFLREHDLLPLPGYAPGQVRG